MIPFGAIYYDHFEKFLGQAVNRKIFRQSEHQPAIQILEYDHVFDGGRVFCSLGLSHYSQEVDGVYEVYSLADDGWNLVPTVLANSLFACVQQRLPLGRGVCIGGIENVNPSFVHKFDKTAVYFTYPYGLPSDFGKVSHRNAIGLILVGFFISEKEREFFAKNGAEQFENLLEMREIDPMHIARKSAL
jgi:hypothetical protein